MNGFVYMPVLKWRMGEFKALAELQPADRAPMMPLIEVPSIPWDFEADAAAKTIDQHLAPTASQVQKHWGTAPICFDLSLLEPSARMNTGLHPLTSLFADFRAHGVAAVPVVGPSYDPAYAAAAAVEIARDQRGACIRLGAEEFLVNASKPAWLALLAALGVAPRDVDLVLDLEDLGDVDPQVAANAVLYVLPQLAHLHDWRSLTLAAAAFPQNLSAFGQGLGSCPRTDWGTWLRIRAGLPSGVRLPMFGDYAIANPEQSEIDPRIMQMSANLRYTCASEWAIFKGRGVRAQGFSQYQQLCSNAAADPRFCGRQFSWGDEYIANCATGAASTGNATTWRRVATNHHLTFVVRQIASTLGAAASPGPFAAAPAA